MLPECLVFCAYTFIQINPGGNDRKYLQARHLLREKTWTK
jgi:hypothetical protein